MLVATSAVGRGGGFGVLGDPGQPGGERIDVSEHVRAGQRLGQARGGGFDLACIAGTGGQPLFQQRDFGAQVVEATAEVDERRFGVARLPRSDGSLAGSADQPHRSVVVHAAESVWVTGGRRRNRVRVGAGRRFGPGPRSGPRDGPGFVVWLVRRHELPLPTLRAVIGRAPAAHCGAVDTRCFCQHLNQY